jgi:exodeoxyribonuclease V alpha subunit
LSSTALRLELDAGQVIADQVEGRDCVFLGGLYHAERSIADRLRILLRGSMPWKSIDAEKAIPWVEARTGLALADSQKTAIHAALRSKVMVITGGPGVGKTTLVNSILRILAARERRRARCETYRGLPAGVPKPDCSERPQDQFWADARSVGSTGCNGFLFR